MRKLPKVRLENSSRLLTKELKAWTQEAMLEVLPRLTKGLARLEPRPLTKDLAMWAAEATRQLKDPVESL